jgi:glycosyltransferase involved in cell wall biosynthesis
MTLGRISDFIWAPLSNVLRSAILKFFLTNELCAKIASYDPQVIMAEDMYVAPACLEVSRKLQLPFVYRIHHLYNVIYIGHPFQRILRRWEFEVLGKADLLLTLTEEDKEITKKMFGVCPETTQFGLDLPDSDEIAGTLKPRADEFVLYVSSYLGKELCWLRKAASFFPNTTFVFVGRGAEASASLPRNIKRLGIVSEQELATLYIRCKFVLIPSEWSPGRGFPIKLAEALRSNRPILLNEKASWLLPRMDAGIHTFATESDLYEEIGFLLNEHQAFRRDSHFFDWDAASRRLENHLKRILIKKSNACSRID